MSMFSSVLIILFGLFLWRVEFKLTSAFTIHAGIIMFIFHFLLWIEGF